jgi:hypothetical protein
VRWTGTLCNPYTQVELVIFIVFIVFIACILIITYFVGEP